MRGPKYTIIFAACLSLVSSVLLSGVFMSLKDKQDENKALDKQINILKAAQITPNSDKEAKELYKRLVIPMVIDRNGQEFSEKNPQSITETDPQYLALYAIKKEENSPDIKAYVYPVAGKGLWSSLYGYLAVDNLGKNIVGITFYQQGETPGLGAEIEKKWFRDNFIGKSLFSENKFWGIKVAKASAMLDKDYKTHANNIVNGISGATITSDGVSLMLKKIPQRYEAFFAKKRVNHEH